MQMIAVSLATLTLSLTLILSVATPSNNQAGTPTTVKHLPGILASSPDLPFSEAVRVGDMLYLSGMLGTVPGTRNLAPGGVKGETKQILDNMRKILEGNGSGLNRVVKCTVILADIKEWPAMNEVYSTYFEKGKFPARTAFESSGLLFGARVEIECLASAK
ncbi:MAG TPA: RidA family protein [Pyrinomonadaceae bacterium]|nr:RidA family protein [Pyrinomonadaceae bacterium]